ncbi:hypothetical protein F2Q69_00046117 [Brassica cretica]|uniref:Uncharacterized protein n=1 Tax=Brassica cretica TaxID=69181 RepID=A0A8S9PWW1_BRACR|nr:hypothetical protein F2Q69_00046117 [Brassica cretica]
MVEYLCGGRVLGDMDRSKSFEVRGGRRIDRRESSTTGSKHDGKSRNQTKNPNFGIMEVFDEAEGSGNIYRQGPKSGQLTEKLEVARCMGSERGVNHLTSRVSPEARGVTVHGSSTCSMTCRSTRWIDQARASHVEHEVPPHMRPEPCEATHGRPLT